MMHQVEQYKTVSWLKLLSTLQIVRAVRLVWNSSKSWTIAETALLIIQGLLPLASLYLMKLIVDGIVAGPSRADFNGIAALIALAALAALLTAVSRSASSLVNEAQAALVSDHVQDLLHAKSIEVDLEYYENSKYYNALHRAQEEAPYRPTRIVNGLAQLGQSAISLAAVAALLVSLNGIMAFILLAGALPAVIVRIKYSKILYQWQRKATERMRRAWYYHWLLINDNCAKEIRLFDLGKLFKERYRDLRYQLRVEKLNINTKKSIADIAAQSLAVLALFGSIAFIAYQSFLGAITVGALVMYIGAIQQGQGFLQSLLSSLAGLYEDNLFLTNFYEFMSLEPRVREPTDPKPLPRPILRGTNLENVSFCYPGTNIPVLKDVSLHIAPGQTIALVGENGSGKTTLIKLLCRLYDPTGGRITLDGIDLRDFRISDLRRGISVVFQDYVHYSMTVKENIWLGKAAMSPDLESITEAARQSGAHGFIQELEGGYEARLGQWFEGGVELSVGQWQKIALARAFFRDAQLIILDEPTSSLDARAESEVFGKFKQLAEGRTAIIISHRLSAVRMADCIYFLKDGKIVENGSHDKLIKLGGNYAELYQIQAGHYR
ncbi:MAG: ABC transporter ATP-binding protein [Methanothrix sp.]